jgi:hypothetical protein
MIGSNPVLLLERMSKKNHRSQKNKGFYPHNLTKESVAQPPDLTSQTFSCQYGYNNCILMFGRKESENLKQMKVIGLDSNVSPMR